MTSNRSLPPTHREAIREIFLRRRIEYTTQQAAQLLRLSVGEFYAWIDRGVLHVERRRKRRQLGGRRNALVTWKELASVAMLRWTPMEIHDALGKEAATTLPRLLRPVEFKGVRLPEYLIRLIEHRAQRERVTVEAFVYTTLLALEAEVDSDEIAQLPGVKEAISFPN